MSNTQSTLRILEKANLAREIDAFLIDRRARALSPRTIDYYDEKLTLFRTYPQGEGIRAVESITAPIVRRFMLELSKTHNPGGVHAVYRAVKAFLRWYDVEVEPEGWSNPMSKVRAPKVPQEPLQPASLPDLRAMLATCKGRKALTDRRDRAVMLALLDTGLRASELIALNVGDVDMRTGSVMVRHGKGNKFRNVFLGGKSRRALVSYLRMRADVGDRAPLFATVTGGRLTYAGRRPDPLDVFAQVADVVDHFLDFSRSIADQRTMVEMIACHMLGTYLLDAFNVVGFLWPNGHRGSGKTQLLLVHTELSYLGQVILAGGSYASLRDLADYGATLGFDDAENIKDFKRFDPDKRALPSGRES